MNDLILQPVILMCLLSFIMMLWMYATRIPASKEIEQAGINLQDLSHPSKLGGVFPSKVERVADNYNHLFEQPVAFYAVTLSIALINNFDSFMVQLAWAFVILRIIHSLVQLTINIVLVRFLLFASGWLIIAYMAYSQLFG